MHDVGVLVELQHDRARFAAAIEQAVSTGDLRSAERTALGDTHEGFGSALCEHWKFPSSLVWVAGHHHAPMSVPNANRDLPLIVHVADHVAGAVAGGFTLDLRAEGPDPEVLETLKIGERGLEEVGVSLAEGLWDYVPRTGPPS